MAPNDTMTIKDLPPSYERCSLEGKVAVVTGSTQGLGEATVRLFKERGCMGLVITGRNRERGEKLATELTCNSCEVIFVKADLANLDEVRKIMKATDECFGTLHILVNAAATTDRGSIWDTTPEDYDRIMNVNTKAPFFLIQDAARIMEREKVNGSIVNISSTASYGSMPMLAAYGMSKGALNVATKNAAYSLMWSKIRVNALAIGWMDTPGEDAIQRLQTDEDNWKEIGEAQQPFGRLLKPDEVARCIAFCASEESGMMTGCVIDFDQSVWGAGNAPVPPRKEEWARPKGMTFSFEPQPKKGPEMEKEPEKVVVEKEEKETEKELEAQSSPQEMHTMSISMKPKTKVKKKKSIDKSFQTKSKPKESKASPSPSARTPVPEPLPTPKSIMKETKETSSPKAISEKPATPPSLKTRTVPILKATPPSPTAEKTIPRLKANPKDSPPEYPILDDVKPEDSKETPSSPKTPVTPPESPKTIPLKSADPDSEGGEKLLMLFSSFAKLEQRSAQDRALTILKGMQIESDQVETIDGAIPANKERRNELFDISGVRGKYPQFFLVNEHGKVTYLADWEQFESMHDSRTLPSPKASPAAMKAKLKTMPVRKIQSVPVLKVTHKELSQSPKTPTLKTKLKEWKDATAALPSPMELLPTAKKGKSKKTDSPSRRRSSKAAATSISPSRRRSQKATATSDSPSKRRSQKAQAKSISPSRRRSQKNNIDAPKSAPSIRKASITKATIDRAGSPGKNRSLTKIKTKVATATWPPNKPDSQKLKDMPYPSSPSASGSGRRSKVSDRWPPSTSKGEHGAETPVTNDPSVSSSESERDTQRYSIPLAPFINDNEEKDDCKSKDSTIRSKDSDGSSRRLKKSYGSSDDSYTDGSNTMTKKKNKARRNSKKKKGSNPSSPSRNSQASNKTHEDGSYPKLDRADPREFLLNRQIEDGNEQEELVNKKKNGRKLASSAPKEIAVDFSDPTSPTQVQRILQDAGGSPRPDEFLHGMDYCPYQPKKERTPKKLGRNTNEKYRAERVQDWLGAEKTMKRSWKVRQVRDIPTGSLSSDRSSLHDD